MLAAKDPLSPHRKAALQTLVETYWKPLYYFVRRRGNDREFSKDITQGFFAAIIERNFLQYVDRGRGKFRTFLLTAIQHYMADEFDRASAQKRGGGGHVLSMDFEQAEAEGLLDRASEEGPDQVYRREWALRVLAQAMHSLREEYKAANRLNEFETLKLHLNYGVSSGPRYTDLAKRLGLSESDIRNRIHRARIHLREAILGVPVP